MKRRDAKQVTLQQKKDECYLVSVPAWVVEKVLDAKKGTKLVWDFQGNMAILTKVKE